MNLQVLKDTVGWGFLLWLIGYILGFIFFFIVPPALIGWFIMPVGMALSLWVLFKRIQSSSFQYYLLIGVLWTLIAIIFDYFFLVQLLKPADGYYKLDVYLYYGLTFALPLIAGWIKKA